MERDNGTGEARSLSYLRGAMLLTVLLGLGLLVGRNYLLFHTLVELTSSAVTLSIFMVAFNARRHLDNHYLLLLGLAYPFVGVMDMVHALAYKGMGVFPDNTASDLATQLWIATRMLEVGTLAVAPVALYRRLRVGPVLLVYAALTTLLLLAIFAIDLFPVCFREGVGLTPFKVGAEYVMITVLAVSLFVLARHRERFEGQVFIWLAISVGCTMAAELAFTLYQDLYGVFNFVGHMLKLASLYYIYRAIVETGLRRPLDLMFRDLSEAKRMAEQGTAAKSMFLANMSHEIRTPMNGLIGMLGLVMRTPLTEQQREQLSTARRSARALMTIIDNVLDLSRIEAGKLALEAEPLDLRQLVHRTTSLFQVEAQAKGLRLESEVDPDLPRYLLGDTVRLGQVLANLLKNAIKFTRRGDVRVTVECRPGAPEGRARLCLDVEDTGIGVEPAQVARIFETFTQADDSITRRYGGTGLGLTISRDLVQLMGGEITMESEPDRGTTVRVDLELEVTDKRPDSSSLELPAPVKIKDGARVLVAEDNLINQQVIRAMLRRLGVESALAADGARALEALEGGEFDLVLMDIQMPELDGMEATRRIRAREEGSGARLPVVALTAHAMRGDRERFLEAGMDDYLSKPVDPQELMRVLSKYLSGKAI